MVERSYPGIEGVFVHPVSDAAVIAGNGTIGLEIIEDLPDVDTILVPFGGGGLSSPGQPEVLPHEARRRVQLLLTGMPA